MATPPNTTRRPSADSPQSTGEIAGLPARRAALKLLDAVLRRGQPLETALHGATQGLGTPADRSLVHAIVAATLRHLPDLDEMIDSATKQVLPDDAKARMVLRLAMAQALLLETPPHAVVATALPLVDGGPRKLVHGVLGTLLRRGAQLPEPPTMLTPPAMRWNDAWGPEMIEAAAVAMSARPPLDISLKDVSTTAAWAERLGAISLASGHLRLPAETDVTSLDGFADGDWWVQDLAASIPARLLGAGEGRTVLDLCAAPGGKTMQLVSAGWNVTALDQSQRRLERLEETLQRTGLSADIVCANLNEWAPTAPAEAILLDAPCSATGIFRRHPDVLHRIGNRQIAEMAEIQTILLDRAIDWLKPGGRLVYATCSLEPAEGEAQIDALLSKRSDVRALAFDPAILPAGIAPSAPGRVRTLPGMLAEQGGLDGFFIAVVERS